jgi:hypothetical protein
MAKNLHICHVLVFFLLFWSGCLFVVLPSVLPSFLLECFLSAWGVVLCRAVEPKSRGSRLIFIRINVKTYFSTLNIKSLFCIVSCMDYMIYDALVETTKIFLLNFFFFFLLFFWLHSVFMICFIKKYFRFITVLKTVHNFFILL